MTFSSLQRYILREAYMSRQKQFSRRGMAKFYQYHKPMPSAKDQQNIITKSIERLIDKGYLIGYGRRTPQKWFIDSIALTAPGRKAGKKFMGEQQALPLRNSKLRIKNSK
ncbi:MAG: hypothetical protein WC734_05215 [Patescibacteria group bacterium]|jgi:hypothetical protein